jgi:hypothetical protein
MQQSLQLILSSTRSYQEQKCYLDASRYLPKRCGGRHKQEKCKTIELFKVTKNVGLKLIFFFCGHKCIATELQPKQEDTSERQGAHIEDTILDLKDSLSKKLLYLILIKCSILNNYRGILKISY